MPRLARSFESPSAESAASRFLTAATAVGGIGAVTLATRDMARAVGSYHAPGFTIRSGQLEGSNNRRVTAIRDASARSSGR
jgi:hypothetical protein